MEEAWANLDQFVLVYPELGQMMDDHDQRLQALCVRASEYHSALAGNVILQGLANGMAAAADATEVADIAAEYVVNGVGHLPNYYSTATFWNAHATEFLKLAESPETRRFKDALEVAASEFKLALDRLVKALMSVRNELSLELGVPIVESVAS